MTELSKTAWMFKDNLELSKVVPYKIKSSWRQVSSPVCRKCSKEEAAIAEQIGQTSPGWKRHLTNRMIAKPRN
ncbi:MAG: hypothetical protein LUG99_16225 [Lachnospiraceae bacterium]|nr:hypothetical protein [Lachnospiraceae bacterium]